MKKGEVEPVARKILGDDATLVVDDDGRVGVEVIDQDSGEVLTHFLVAASGAVLDAGLAESLGLRDRVEQLAMRLKAAYVPPEPPALVKNAWERPPRCLSRFRTRPILTPEEGMTTFPELAYLAVDCPCGEVGSKVLGFRKGALFLGPLATECENCKRQVELFDPRVDGYNGEIGCSSTAVGRGRRKPYCCDCGGLVFELRVGVSYQGLSQEDLEPGQWAHVQNFFDNFWLYGRCRSCGRLADICSAECA